ncbi:hypothetical protein P692DRAFT_201810771 [Suillus brevipes Sb2]|nr:hypothetical protein P692DRAFT_201810771 [Suillus brevipes Sb2]
MDSNNYADPMAPGFNLSRITFLHNPTAGSPRAAEVEHLLQILGATDLEDKLQEGVPEAIEMLHRAGIKLWILTGDKLQTVIEIGFSCNLLKQDMEVMILSADSPEGTLAQTEAGLNKIASIFGPPTSKRMERGFAPGAKASFAVVIDVRQNAQIDPLRVATRMGKAGITLYVIACESTLSQYYKRASDFYAGLVKKTRGKVVNLGDLNILSTLVAGSALEVADSEKYVTQYQETERW